MATNSENCCRRGLAGKAGYTMAIKSMLRCIKATRINMIANENAEKALISEGFTNWRDAATTGKGFDAHFQSESHYEAGERLAMIKNNRSIAKVG